MTTSDSTAGGGPPRGRPDAVAVLAADGTVTGWTRAARELLGHGDTDLGRGAVRLLPPRGPDAGPPTWPDGTEQHWSGLLEVQGGDGGALVVHADVLRLDGAGERPSWLVCMGSVEDASDRMSSMLEPLLRRSPLALLVWDRDLRCVWMNTAAERLQPVFPHYRVGRRLTDPPPGIDTRAAVEAISRVLADGVPLFDEEVHRTSPDGREDVTLSISHFRLDGVDGRPLGVCSVALDISHSRARRRLAVLREASTRIGTTLDVRQTAQEMADLAVPDLADFVTVDLAESVLPDAEPLQHLTSSENSVPVFRRAGAASIHDGVPESMWPIGEPVYVPPASPFTRVLDTGRSHFEPVLDTSPGGWLDVDPDRSRVIAATGMHTLIVVPLKARGDILGVTVFVRTDNRTPFTRDDLVLAEELAARAALSLDNARQYTREHAAALALQRNLLPRNLTGGGAVDVASRYLPSDAHVGVGGDWYDAIPLDGGRIALVVGDVTGHGINAAATMGRLRTAVRTLAYLDLPPHRVLLQLDRLVVRQAEEERTPFDPAGATCVYAVYDPASGFCTIATAGHPPPAIVHPDGEVAFPRPPGGLPIGLGIGDYEPLTVDLAEGSLIALYTDGLIETRDADIETGIERLGTALAQAEPPLDDFCTTVIRLMTGNRQAEDDIALLVARTLRT
ncbi:SpoIIE family protein phosphatase [Actinomadura geliboluensis]|nr:SpoIIE family protein phosphatase [Actinomadura geliboluensis]